MWKWFLNLKIMAIDHLIKFFMISYGTLATLIIIVCLLTKYISTRKITTLFILFINIFSENYLQYFRSNFLNYFQNIF